MFLKAFFPTWENFFHSFCTQFHHFTWHQCLILSFGHAITIQNYVWFASLFYTFCTSLSRSESRNFFNVIFLIIKLEILSNITPLCPVILLCFCYFCEEWSLATPNLARDSGKVSVFLIAVLFRLSVRYLCPSSHISRVKYIYIGGH